MELIENCWIIETDVTGMIVEIALEENNNLLNDITKKNFTKRLNQRRYEEKIGHGYKIGNLFITLKVCNGF